MDSDNQEQIYCADDNEYMIYCDICDKICIDRYHNNHPKSRLLINIIHKKQRINITNIHK